VPVVATCPPEVLAKGDAPRVDTRGRVFSPAKPRGTYRIALLGGSSAWGLAQPSRAESITGRLEALLAGRSTPVEVLCLANLGHTSDQELGWVVAHASHWGVDLFLAVDAYNDITYASGPDVAPGHMYAWRQHRFALERPILRWLYWRSMLLRPLVAPHVLGAKESLSERLASPDACNAHYLDALVANEEAIAAVASDAGARFVWSSVPIVYDRTVLGPGEAALARPEPQAKEVRARMAEARRRVPPAIAVLGGRSIDLTARIARRSAAAAPERWFDDECHYTDRGCAVVAEEIVAELGAQGLPP